MMSSDGFVPLQERLFTTTQELNFDQAAMSKSSISGGDSEPRIPPDSPGSSVSSRLQEEYDELLKYAVVVPSYPTISSLGLGRSIASGDHRLFTAQSKSPADGDQLTPQAEQKVVQITSHSAGNLRPDPERQPSTASVKFKATAVADIVDTNLPASHESSSTIEYERAEDGFTKKSDVGLHVFDDQLQQPAGFTQRPFSLKVPQQDLASEQASVNDDAMTDDGADGVTYTYTASIDQDMSRMENLLDQWTSDLKRNILGEFGQTKIRLIEQQRQQMLREKQRHAGDSNRLQNEIEALRELLATYEQSIKRKDQVISNLTAGLQHHRNRMELHRSFSEWKIKHNDAKREAFASNLARKHYHRTLQQKIWTAWHSLVEAKWRQRVEKACQSKAQEVCIALTNDYETKLASLNEALGVARQEVCRLHDERERYEESMKKAFMRGVCALNLEAMTMFHDPDGREPGQGRVEADEHADSGDDVRDVDRHPRPVTIPQEYVYHTEQTAGPSPRVVTGQLPTGAAVPSRVNVTDVAKSRPAGRGAKVVTARITATQDGKRTGSGAIAGQTLAPPMPSVVVERHQPITKQTIGHATAAKYTQPRTSTPPAVIQRKLAGQQGVNVPMTNIQTIKVVE